MNRITKVFQPLIVVPKNAVVKKIDQQSTSRSQKLMTELGLIQPAHNGTYYVLPLLQRSVDKLTKLVDEHMHEIGGQKLSLPILTPADLWQKSGRLKDAGREIMKSIDRYEHTQILSPTNEESVTALLASLSPVSYKQLPLRLYQIGVKFRDEMKPRFGIIRAKEFLMKDMYTFDGTEKAARQTYDRVNDQYVKLLESLSLKYIKVKGDTGMMGGNISHEYHLPASIGDDTLLQCRSCGHATNAECLSDTRQKETGCEMCDSEKVDRTPGIEVCHTFLLGEKYSQLLGANIMLNDGGISPMVMGCYGIGMTRLIAAAIEVLSTDTDMKWPSAIAPYTICIIPPKKGSQDEEVGHNLSTAIYDSLNLVPTFKGDIIVDDRNQLTIGKRLLMAKRMGYPVVIVIGGKCRDPNPTVELYYLNRSIQVDVRPEDLLRHIGETPLD